MTKNPEQSKLIAEIKKADNILIALNANPTIDELASALGLTLMLNKNKRRAVAIFSGQIPDVLGFLNMAETFDTNADGLRDFIVTLDAKKADRVVCKAEEGMVKVYITPSGEIVGSDDLEFSQGDYNVDLVIGLGVTRKEDFDKALAAHGRILHSASVASIMIGDKTSNLGTINLREVAAGSYAEVLAGFEKDLDAGLTDSEEPAMDKAVATAFLTSLVSVTDRFSNNKTTAEVMELAADLMKMGANQQLVANELAKSEQPAEQVITKSDDKENEQTVDLKLAKSGKDSKAEPKGEALDLKSVKSAGAVKKPKELVIDPLPKAEETPEQLVEADIQSEPELVKPTLDNLEAYSEQRTDAERTEVAKEIMERLEREQPVPAAPVEETVLTPSQSVPVEEPAPTPEVAAPVAPVVETPLTVATELVDDQLQQQLDQATQQPTPFISEVPDFESAPIPVAPAVTQPNPNIVFGREVDDSAPAAVPSTVWGQPITEPTDIIPEFTPPSGRAGETVINPLPPEPVVPAPIAPVEPAVEPLAPVAEPIPAPINELTPSPEVTAPPVPPIPPSMPDLPPLPDFSSFNVAPPLPPTPPAFDSPAMPPQFDAATLAQPAPAVNPFDQFSPDNLPPAAPTMPLATSPVAQNPVMQDQVYPTPPADKAQFVIPE